MSDTNAAPDDPQTTEETGSNGYKGRLLAYEMDSHKNFEHHLAWSAKHKIQPVSEDGRIQLFYSVMSRHRAQQMYRSSRDYIANILAHYRAIEQQQQGVLVDGNVHVPDFNALLANGCQYPSVVVVRDPNHVCVSDLTARDHDFFPENMFVDERSQKYYKDSQHFYASALAKEPVVPLPGRGPENHFVPLARLCYSCCTEFAADRISLYNFSQLRRGVITVVHQPRSDGLTIVQPKWSQCCHTDPSTAQSYAFNVHIFGDECSVEVGQLVVLICGRRGLLAEFSYSNLTFTMLQTDGQRLCVRYTEILAPIKSQLIDPIVTDAAGTEMRVGDAVSINLHGKRFGQIWEILDWDVYIDVDCPIYGQKFVVFPANTVYKTIQAILYQNVSGTNDLSVPATFNTDIVTFDDLMKEYGEPNIRVLFDKDVTGAMLFLYRGYVAYCTRLSMDSAFFMLLGDEVQRTLPTRHVQQPPTIFLENHLRAARASNGALIVRGANVVRVKDRKNVPVPSYVECSFFGWLAMRPHVTFTLRPYDIEKGENVLLIDDYFDEYKKTHSKAESALEQRRLDDLLLRGMIPMCFQKFKLAYPQHYEEIEEARRKEVAAPFIERASVVIQTLIDQFDLPRSQVDYTSRRRRNVPYVNSFSHFMQTDAVMGREPSELEVPPSLKHAELLGVCTFGGASGVVAEGQGVDESEEISQMQHFADKLYLLLDRKKALAKSVVREDDDVAKAAAVAALTAVPRNPAPSASSSFYVGDKSSASHSGEAFPRIVAEPCTINMEEDSDDEGMDYSWAEGVDNGENE